jgi:hypothetical protein
VSELFEFGLDFGLTYFEPLPKKKQLSMQEYRTGYVDFYDQTLDPTLGTGIDIPRGDDDDDDDDEEKRDINIYRIGKGDSEKSNDSDIPSPLDVSSANIYDLKSVPTYGEALGDAGFGDKTPFNVLGNDIYFGGIPRTKEEAKRGLERLVSKDSLLRTGAKTASKFLGVNPLVSGTAAAFATGRTVKDPFGNASFRPSSFVLGGVHDINMSIQYDNVAQMQAAKNTTGPKGYATYINGQLVTRPPKGFNYTGTYDVPRETLLRMDAISKGFVPSSFDYRTESGERGVVDGIGGMYDERGVYHDRNGTSAYGSRKASDSLGKQVGLTTTKVEQILADVRADNEKKLSEEIQKAQQEQVEQRIQDEPSVTQMPTYTSPTYEYQYYQDSDDGGSFDSGGADASDPSSSDMGFSTRYGGQIGQGMQSGGPAGFIGGPPEKFSDQTTIADDIPLEVPEGAFVINAPAVEYAGSEDISKMLTEAYEKAGQGVDKSGRTTTIPSREQVDIMISRGEVVVPPNIAKVIGYDRLEKINNRGKREVARRQKQGDQERPQARQANMGGFINKAEGDKITVYRGEPPKNKIPLGAKLLQDKYTGSWFAPDKNFTKTYGEVAKSMKVSFDEYKKGAKKAFLKKNIARSKMENEKSGLPRNLTRKQRSQIFQSLKYIDEIADNVKQGKRSTKAFVDFLYEGVFPKEKDRATVMLLETAKRSPKVFGKLVVDSLVKNVVSKGVPVLGAIAGFAPKEMGDATLDNSGFIQYERVQ